MKKEYVTKTLDSHKWDDYVPKDGDIVVATYYKCGSTWMQQIVYSLLYHGEPPTDRPVTEMAPQPEMKLLPFSWDTLPDINGRRMVKTGLPADVVPFYSNVKYIYVGRDGRDAFMSLDNHWSSRNEKYYKSPHALPRYTDPPVSGDTGRFFDEWISKGNPCLPWETDGWPFWSLFRSIESWWHMRDKRNVLMVHFKNLKQDLEGQMKRIASFLEIDIDETALKQAADKCTFAHMKENALSVLGEQFSQSWGEGGQAGAQTFIFKGTDGRWKNVLTDQQMAKYAAKVAALPASCAHWLQTGEMVPMDDTHGAFIH